jgi:two-component system, chemotaxis family, chemotaxis protein CheY
MRKKIVFVDDSRVVISAINKAVENLVESGAIEHYSFTNPEEFLSLIENENFEYDMLFVDINMPQMNGLELAKRLKKRESLARKPILALTTEESDEIKSLGKKIGLSGWVLKPFSDKKITTAIQKVLGI